jgi:hypothetical protein
MLRQIYKHHILWNQIKSKLLSFTIDENIFNSKSWTLDFYGLFLEILRVVSREGENISSYFYFCIIDSGHVDAPKFET